jgi:hypothetical protein
MFCKQCIAFLLDTQSILPPAAGCAAHSSPHPCLACALSNKCSFLNVYKSEVHYAAATSSSNVHPSNGMLLLSSFCITCRKGRSTRASHKGVVPISSICHNLVSSVVFQLPGRHLATVPVGAYQPSTQPIISFINGRWGPVGPHRPHSG